MKLLLINSVCGVRSTGRIVIDIAKQYEKKGYDVKIAYGRCDVPENYLKYVSKIGNNLSFICHVLLTFIFGKHGLYSKRATKKLLKWAESFNPDVLWLHNIHGYYINYELLFNWIKSRPQMEVKWTLHDCWSFTGHCPHFSMVHCNKWKTGCHHCPQKTIYPFSLIFDNSKYNYEKKIQSFTNVSRMTLITPSHWLKNLVSQSFLSEYPVLVVYNRVDQNYFKPVVSKFKERYGIVSKKMILGVANIWEKRKGLNDFLELHQRLDPKLYVIVLVGLSGKQIKKIPDGMIGIERTDSQIELAEIYSAADVYVNTSKEETFGMTTLEAISCGTKVIVYKHTACEEIVNKYGGMAIEENIDELFAAVRNSCSENM